MLANPKLPGKSYLNTSFFNMSCIDADYVKEFFYSFRGIIAPIKLLTMLIER